MKTLRGPIGADEGLARATALVRALPILWAEKDAGATEGDVTARGWFKGADECARILATSTKFELCRGGGFGGTWPLLRGTNCAISPTLPVVVGHPAVIGPDGEYSLDAAGVWREAVGVRELYLAIDASHASPGAPFDLLWFGEAERFLVRGGWLEIDDLFGTLCMPATPSLLDRILIRRLRVEGGLLESLHLAATEGPQKIEVRRPAALNAAERWRDAARFLAARADIEDVQQHSSRLAARGVGGLELSFELEDGSAGWLLTLRQGDYVLSEIRLEYAANILKLSATIDPRIDALAPGMRGRLIFDLRSDLVALG